MAKAKCARCGWVIPPTSVLRSRHTGQTYCIELDDCARRARNQLNVAELNQLMAEVSREIGRARKLARLAA